jgi:transcriptional antiterminator RfaH
MSPYWAVAQLVPQREALAVHFLAMAGYELFSPRLKQQRVSHGRKIITTPLLFPGYVFVSIVAGWWNARWSPGVVRLILDGTEPAKVPLTVITELRKRAGEDGLIDLPKGPALRRGARVRVLAGPFAGRLAIFADMKPRERVEILLQLLGGEQRVTLAKKDIEVVR